ncbi:uncharacterized protein PGTG_18472 [Puccinia graminis f. sp. tritici CRL 75-36-700-3]|uniref:Uncharacterized protein n=1 Tax=Puccinia graminis f. sp. tritici (strain CRL 75-36-700-3 / race SCCL) TaxID=418459 RepID=E3L6T2_PUCGT|nr:uncharacterized protein PGTG_18472 [Puccinia graminis f. sp. tritici CRL 75-36-700-3]EFP92257.1 hypothetical protein PGTG_18472 [Puccinia graminis f. sp. tritici CRL 75-36-700-3]
MRQPSAMSASRLISSGFHGPVYPETYLELVKHNKSGLSAIYPNRRRQANNVPSAAFGHGLAPVAYDTLSIDSTRLALINFLPLFKTKPSHASEESPCWAPTESVEIRCAPVGESASSGRIHNPYLARPSRQRVICYFCRTRDFP